MTGRAYKLAAVCTALAIGTGTAAYGMTATAQEEERDEWIEYIEYICEGCGICPELVEAIIERESSWNPDAVNGSCIGLMQISEGWHQDRMESLGVTDLTDPYDNIDVGVDYLLELFTEYEDPALVLTIYSGNSTESLLEDGVMCGYAEEVLKRSAELEREHGK